MTDDGAQPIEIRACARVILVRDDGRALLVRYHDDVPMDPARPLADYWLTIGGGVDKGETHEQAALRELEEETGLRIARLGPCVGTRPVRLMVRGRWREDRIRYYAARIDGGAAPRNRTDEPILEHRWWSAAEMRASGETFLPPDLAAWVERVAADDLPHDS